MIDHTLDWTYNYVKFDWSDVPVTIDRTDALGWIRYLIKPSLVSSLIDHLILSWSIGLILIKINRTLDQTFTMSSTIDRTLSRLIRLINTLWSIGWSIDYVDPSRSIGWSIDPIDRLDDHRSYRSITTDRMIYHDWSDMIDWMIYRSYGSITIDRIGSIL